MMRLIKMDDLISRSKAIRWVKAECNPYGQPTLDYESGIKVIEHLERMQSAQPERKKGKWDFIGFQMFRCTACKHVFSQDSLEGWRTYTYEPTFPNFCPNCGAEMEQ